MTKYNLLLVLAFLFIGCKDHPTLDTEYLREFTRRVSDFSLIDDRDIGQSPINNVSKEGYTRYLETEFYPLIDLISHPSNKQLIEDLIDGTWTFRSTWRLHNELNRKVNSLQEELEKVTLIPIFIRSEDIPFEHAYQNARLSFHALYLATVKLHLAYAYSFFSAYLAFECADNKTKASCDRYRQITPRYHRYLKKIDVLSYLDSLADRMKELDQLGLKIGSEEKKRNSPAPIAAELAQLRTKAASALVNAPAFPTKKEALLTLSLEEHLEYLLDFRLSFSNAYLDPSGEEANSVVKMNGIHRKSSLGKEGKVNFPSLSDLRKYQRGLLANRNAIYRLSQETRERAIEVESSSQRQLLGLSELGFRLLEYALLEQECTYRTLMGHWVIRYAGKNPNNLPSAIPSVNGFGRFQDVKKRFLRSVQQINDFPFQHLLSHARKHTKKDSSEYEYLESIVRLVEELQYSRSLNEVELTTFEAFHFNPSFYYALPKHLYDRIAIATDLPMSVCSKDFPF